MPDPERNHHPIRVETQLMHNESNHLVFQITAGNKKLTLEYAPDTNSASSRLDNNTARKRVPGGTWAVCRQALQILQVLATVGNKDIEYTIETGYPKLKAWLQTSGKDLFPNSRPYFSIDDPEKLVIICTISPAAY